MIEGESRPAEQAFVFTGTGSGYFRIWIVNLLLTVVTLGFYSPWAKVRRLRYFYGNTLFDGSPFEFHGRPFALFKGRIIGLVLLLAYTQSAKVSLTFWMIVVGVLFLLLPWLMWKSFRFRFANSSYRGIHFAFDGTLGQAYLTFIPLMLMVLGPVITLTLAEGRAIGGAAIGMRGLVSYYIAVLVVLVLAPWFYFRLRAYQHGYARVGTTAFTFDGRVRTAYGIALKMLGIGIAIAILGALVAGAVGGIAWFLTDSGAARAFRPVPVGIGIAVFYVFLISSWSFNRAMMQNFVWGRTSLAGARFVSTVGSWALWRIELVNIVLTLVTLGFFWPFAVVRSMQYRIGALWWTGDSGDLVTAAESGRIGATGEEASDLFGLDIAL